MTLTIPKGSGLFSGHRTFDVTYAKDEYGQARVRLVSTDDVPGWDPVDTGGWVVSPVDWSGDVPRQVAAGLARFPEWASAVFA